MPNIIHTVFQTKHATIEAYIAWTYEDATRHHKFLAFCDAWIADTNAGITRHKLKQLSTTAERITLTKEESSMRDVVRAWEWAVPVDKFSLAYPGQKCPTPEQVVENRFGKEKIDGKITGCIYTVKDAVARVFCYELRTSFSEGTRLSEVLDEARSDSDEERFKTVRDKQQKAAAVTHERAASMTAVAFNALKAFSAPAPTQDSPQNAEDDTSDDEPIHLFRRWLV